MSESDEIEELFNLKDIGIDLVEKVITILNEEKDLKDILEEIIECELIAERESRKPLVIISKLSGRYVIQFGWVLIYKDKFFKGNEIDVYMDDEEGDE